jgi:hypothetical protein
MGSQIIYRSTGLAGRGAAEGLALYPAAGDRGLGVAILALQHVNRVRKIPEHRRHLGRHPSVGRTSFKR